MAVNIGKRQTLHPPEGIFSDIPHNPVGHAVIAHIHKPLGNRRGKHHQNPSFYQYQDSFKVHVSLIKQKINGISRKNRKIQRQHHGNDRKNNGQRKKRQIMLHIPEHLFQRQKLSPFFFFVRTHALAPSFLNCDS